MPSYKQSKSQKRSQSQSKNGGRRRKHTMRKLRRGKKSRKVMRGGVGDGYDFTTFDGATIRNAIKDYRDMKEKQNDTTIVAQLDSILINTDNNIGQALTDSPINGMTKMGIMLKLDRDQ